MQEILNHSIFGNSVFDYLSSLGLFLGGMVIVYIFKRYVISRLQTWADSTVTSIDDLLVKAIDKALVPVIYIGVFYTALHTLVLSPDFKHA
jgi:hypothetical protein